MPVSKKQSKTREKRIEIFLDVQILKTGDL
jgi:hypothetical protein